MKHPKIEEQRELDGWSKDNSDVDQEFVALQNAKFVLSSPLSRAEALQHIDGLISADDGASLRSKSHLVELRRGLSQTHQAMLKVGR